jgi:membrane-bound ClpP family serine protease
MDIFIIILLVIGAVLLFLIELFVVPGIGLAGIGAVVCLVLANYRAYVDLGTSGFIITLIISLLACLSSLVLLMRSKTLDRVALKESITSSVENLKEPSVRLGDKGTTTTRLALIGYADINGKIVEVSSCDGFLNTNTPIIVERITNGVIFVKKQ